MRTALARKPTESKSHAAPELSAEAAMGARAGMPLFLREKVMQRKPAAGPAPLGRKQDALPARIHQAALGQALSPGLRTAFESELGTDLSQVRIHQDEEADQLAKALSADAFTAGNEIFFRSSQYDPAGEAGRRLIAHEVLHTVQQARGPVDGSDFGTGVHVSDPGDRFEREAEIASVGLARSSAAPVESAIPAKRYDAAAAVPRATGAALRVQRNARERRDAQELYNDTSYPFVLMEDQMARGLAERARRGDYGVLHEAFESVIVGYNTDDIALATARNLSDEELRALATRSEGRRLLQRLQSEMRSGYTGDDEQAQIKRIEDVLAATEQTAALVTFEPGASGGEQASPAPGQSDRLDYPWLDRDPSRHKSQVRVRADGTPTDGQGNPLRPGARHWLWRKRSTTPPPWGSSRRVSIERGRARWATE
jgi:hypothetical protein